ncbi:MAG: uroporphyrinogen-III C-methyltransferase, partial [Crocinitomicaceae bacterium]|nr:uroporphyrinogen-III C-methyltransferase [Crocinitomicaceae bacterium]
GIGRINTIEKIVEEKGLSNPAIIVIGEVVSKSYKLGAIFREVEQYYLDPL